MENMDKKTILAFVLIGVIIMGWSVMMDKMGGSKNRRTPAAPPSASQTSPDSGKGSTAPAESKAVIQRAVSFSRATVPSAVIPADTLDIETSLYSGRLSTASGGTVVGWKLKHFLKTENQPVELIADSTVGNLAIQFDPSIDLSSVSFDVVSDSQWTDKKINRRKIRMAKEFPSFGRVEKEFLFQDGDYRIPLQVRFYPKTNVSAREYYQIQWEGGLEPSEKNIKDDNLYTLAVASQAGELLKTKSESTGLREGKTQWAAVCTKYFLAAILTDGFEAKGVDLRVQKTQIQTEQGPKPWKRFSAYLNIPLESGKPTVQSFIVYLGPRDYRILKSQGVGLEKVMDLGWPVIRPFSIASLYIMEFLHKIVGNYGWVIIIFSILIKVVLYPLTKKSTDSMRKMQELQPKLKALQEKHKGDPQRLNAETMKMYKTQGVNPMGGCLPMILQMPILFALFNVFRTTIMFRQAGFLGLIKDLSGPDHIIPLSAGSGINLLPILMAVTMLIQQKMTVTDPKQKMTSYFMSIFMIYIFYNLSAGLNLYYLMFNLMSIAQEKLIKRKPSAQLETG
jgi:YidC/Oxa1 family membrane protein insertase